jgi:hypothetical protein
MRKSEGSLGGPRVMCWNYAAMHRMFAEYVLSVRNAMREARALDEECPIGIDTTLCVKDGAWIVGDCQCGYCEERGEYVTVTTDAMPLYMADWLFEQRGWPRVSEYRREDLSPAMVAYLNEEPNFDDEVIDRAGSNRLLDHLRDRITPVDVPELNDWQKWTLDDGCTHDWKSYVGFSETYRYCVHCDAKENA